MFILSACAAVFLWTRDRYHVTTSVLTAPLAAFALFTLFKIAFARPRPLGLAHFAPDADYSFPSGHATTSAAVCCTLAYVLWREALLRAPWAIVFAIFVPLLIGASRVYLDVHWATDVLGGWSAGVFVAVVCVVIYDRNTPRSPVEARA